MWTSAFEPTIALQDEHAVPNRTAKPSAQKTTAIQPVFDAPTTVRVVAQGANARDNGKRLAAIVEETAMIAARAQKRHTIRIGAGVFDLGTCPLRISSWIDLQGTGQDATILTGSGNCTLHVMASCTVTDLNIQNFQPAWGSHPRNAALVVSRAHCTLARVTCTAVGHGGVIGLLVKDGQINAVDVASHASGSGHKTAGLSLTADTRGAFRKCHFSVSDSGESSFGAIIGEHASASFADCGFAAGNVKGVAAIRYCASQNGRPRRCA